MPAFFEKFPRTTYDINGKQRTNFEVVPNLFFRLRVVREVLENFTSYYEHIVSDDQTPEILAEMVYRDPTAHWIILLANNIRDAQYDWPLNSNDFQRYIIEKYGSVEIAQTTYHHYEKVVVREEAATGTVVEFRYVINQANLASNLSSTLSTVPYDHYGNLAEDQEVSTYNMQDGGTVVETISRDAITNYDYEVAQNEKKRTIKIIRPEFYAQIIREFDNLAQFEPVYIRKFR
jgi:Base plate wedge protein 53